MIGLWMAVAVLATQQIGTISPGGIEAIGPKQDDPLAMCDPTTNPAGASGIIVQGGIEAIGPKQDDPRSPLKIGVLARPGDDNDPKASGGTGGDKIIVQGGLEAIGPKQDDPRSPVLAIGPKQDDPRAPALRVGVLARPGDDNDPKALAQACAAKR